MVNLNQPLSGEVIIKRFKFTVSISAQKSDISIPATVMSSYYCKYSNIHTTLNYTWLNSMYMWFHIPSANFQQYGFIIEAGFDKCFLTSESKWWKHFLKVNKLVASRWPLCFSLYVRWTSWSINSWSIFVSVPYSLHALLSKADTICFTTSLKNHVASCGRSLQNSREIEKIQSTSSWVARKTWAKMPNSLQMIEELPISTVCLYQMWLH